MQKLEEFLKYDGTVKHGNRPYDIACLEKDDRLRSFVAQYVRMNNGVSVVLDCPEDEVLAVLQQSKLSLTLADSELMWASFAQGCTTFVNGEPAGTENHIHYVVYSLDDLHLAAYNLQRFLQDSRHAADIGRNAYEFVAERVKNGPKQPQIEFSGEISVESNNTELPPTSTVGITTEVIENELAEPQS